MRSCIPDIGHHLHNGHLERFIAHNVIHAGQQFLRLPHNLTGTLNHFIHAHFFQPRQIIAIFQKTGISLSRRNVDKFIAHNSGGADTYLRAFGDLHPFIYLHGDGNPLAVIFHGKDLPHRHSGQADQ